MLFGPGSSGNGGSLGSSSQFGRARQFKEWTIRGRKPDRIPVVRTPLKRPGAARSRTKRVNSMDVSSDPAGEPEAVRGPDGAPFGTSRLAAGDLPEGTLYLDHLRAMISSILEQQVDRVAAQVAARAREIEPAEHQELAMITERELASMLRCDPRTIRRLEKSREIPQAIRIGGSKRWRLQGIRDWMDSKAAEVQR